MQAYLALNSLSAGQVPRTLIFYGSMLFREWAKLYSEFIFVFVGTRRFKEITLPKALTPNSFYLIKKVIKPLSVLPALE